MLGIYFLIFLARHEKEFSEVYSKMEKTEFVRDETGRIIDVADKTPKAIRAFWYAIPGTYDIPRRTSVANRLRIMSAKNPGLDDMIDRIIDNPAYDQMGVTRFSSEDSLSL